MSTLIPNSVRRAMIAAAAGASLVGWRPARARAQDKLRDRASVMDFGAVGDDVADDTAKIQAALDSGAGFIIVPPGVFCLTGTLKVPSNVHLFSLGATFKRKAGASVFDLIQNTDQAGGNTDIIIEGLVLDGNKSADGLRPTVAGDRFSGISLVKVSGKSKVSGCSVTGTVNNETDGGIYLSACSDVLVEKNHCYGNDRTAIYYLNGARNKFIGNICHGNGGSGISGKGCDDAEFSGNQTYSNGSGGNYSGLNASCLRARVEGNVSYSNTGTGITLGEAASADASDASVSGNTVYSNVLDGIYVSNSARVKLHGNTVKDNASNARRANIRIKSDASFCTIAKNTIRGGAGIGATGILLDGGKGHQVLGNDVSRAYSSGIDVLSAATDGTIQGNTCYDNCVGSPANAGIYLESTSGWTVQGNRCFDTRGAAGTQTSGIYVFGGRHNKLIGNDLVGNKTNAILEGGSPSYYRRMNKIDTDPSPSSFAPTGGAT